jgi:hypothetical protein
MRSPAEDFLGPVRCKCSVSNYVWYVQTSRQSRFYALLGKVRFGPDDLFGEENSGPFLFNDTM